MVVVVDGEASDIAHVSSGVPQGSVLGPILFLTFINDTPEAVNSKARLFADNSIIYREVGTAEDCGKLQQDLLALEQWEKMWGISFNPSKCHIIHVSWKKAPISTTYHLKGSELDAVDSATCLGVTLSKPLMAQSRQQGSGKGTSHFGVHQTEHHQCQPEYQRHGLQGLGETNPGVLGISMESTSTGADG